MSEPQTGAYRVWTVSASHDTYRTLAAFTSQERAESWVRAHNAWRDREWEERRVWHEHAFVDKELELDSDPREPYTVPERKVGAERVSLDGLTWEERALLRLVLDVLRIEPDVLVCAFSREETVAVVETMAAADVDLGNETAGAARERALTKLNRLLESAPHA